MSIESFAQAPIQSPPKSYLYAQYSDDEYVQAFVDEFNAIAQGYLDWFNATPLSVYTDSSISGALLDWIAQGVYGITRPSISSETTTEYGEWNTAPWNTVPFNGFVIDISGGIQVASDDVFKRLMTWILYRGDGVRMTMQWLRRRVTRFIYGTGGTDIDLGLLQNISIAAAAGAGATSNIIAGTNSAATNSMATNSAKPKSGSAGASIYNITIPNLPASQSFLALVKAGMIPMPMQFDFEVTIA